MTDTFVSVSTDPHCNADCTWPNVACDLLPGENVQEQVSGIAATPPALTLIDAIRRGERASS